MSVFMCSGGHDLSVDMHANNWHHGFRDTRCNAEEELLLQLSFVLCYRAVLVK